MGKVMPLTPGMLVSALMRYDHGLFAPYFEDDVLCQMRRHPQETIPKAIKDVIEIYDEVTRNAELDTVTKRQVAEEFTQQGFYTPGNEDGYASTLDIYELRAFATTSIGDRGEART